MNKEQGGQHFPQVSREIDQHSQDSCDPGWVGLKTWSRPFFWVGAYNL